MNDVMHDAWLQDQDIESRVRIARNDLTWLEPHIPHADRMIVEDAIRVLDALRDRIVARWD